MSNYDETLAEELEVLESIYPDELRKISPTHLELTVEPEVPISTEPLTLCFAVQYPPEYPDVLPELELEAETGELQDDEREQLLAELKTVGEESLGMAMVFTLVTHLREALSTLVQKRLDDARAAENARHAAEEEKAAAFLRGTKVTPESFAAWRKTFMEDRKAKKEKEEEERLRLLPPREREEARKAKNKLTGRQLFQQDKTLANSDAALGEDGAVEVDFSKYSRDEPREDEDEDEDNGIKLNYDSD